MRHRLIPDGRAEARRVLLPEEMRRADAFCIEQLGVPGIVLMENAGRHLAAVAAERAPEGARVGVVCGGGNNGGDGYVAARHLAAWGREVDVVLVKDPAELEGDAATNFQVLRHAGVRVRRADVREAIATLPRPGHYALLVDALLGTGLRGEVRSPYDEAIRWINGHGAQVVACDIPSGLSGESGQVLGCAVRADCTVSFATSKLGHWLYPGPAHTGELSVVDIGMPVGVVSAHAGSRWILGDDDLAPIRAARAADTHKGSFGHVYVLGGAAGRTGAVRMTADAALRAGAGLVSIGTTEEAFPGLAAQLYEVMAEPALRETAEPARAATELAERINARSAAVVGPGFPTGPDAAELLATLLPAVERPLVVDADGLNMLAGHWGAFRGPERVLTPHPGEAARLLGCSTAEVQADRVGAAARIASQADAVVVLKGAHTLVCAPEGTLGVCPDGNPGMASAGMGDALAGVIGTLLGQGLDAFDAASAGVLWHARAGDRAAARRGEAGLLTRHLIEALAEVVAC